MRVFLTGATGFVGSAIIQELIGAGHQVLGLARTYEAAKSLENMPRPGPNPRIASEEAADSVAADGVRVSVVRLAPSVHGDGDHAFLATLIKIAREKGRSVYIGDGLNHWPAVHRLDAGQLFRLVLEKAPSAGTRLHGVAEEGIALRDIAAVIGRRLNIPTVSILPEEAAAHFGSFAHFAALDISASSQRTQELLGWNPVRVGLIADLDRDGYFQ